MNDIWIGFEWNTCFKWVLNETNSKWIQNEFKWILNVSWIRPGSLVWFDYIWINFNGILNDILNKFWMWFDV